jgi:hypothetical protein
MVNVSTEITDGLEATLGRIDAAVESSLRQANTVVRELKKARVAAATGALNELERSLEAAKDLAASLVDATRALRSAWNFDGRAYLESGAYVDELIRLGRSRGLSLLEQDGRLIGYPFLLRVLPTEGAIEIDRKRDRRIRPSFLVKQLGSLQTRPARFRPDQFIESLYRGYRLALAERGKQHGAVIRLSDIHGILTVLPGQAREYSKQEFARDIYLLDESPVSRTRDGAVISFAASTGTKGAGSLVTVARDGSIRTYYGVSFAR